MYNIIIYISIALLTLSGGLAYQNHTTGELEPVGLSTFKSVQVGSSAANTYLLQTDGTDSTWVNPTSIGGLGGANVFGDLGDVSTSSDATGDVYYLNASGQLTNLGIGSAGQVLEVSGGLPSWGTDDGLFAWTPTALGNSTSTLLQLTAGTLITGSSTIIGSTTITSGDLTVGARDTMTVNGSVISSRLMVHETDGLTSTEQEWHRHSDTAGAGSSVYGARSRGGEGTETAVQDNDNLLRITAVGHDGTDYATAGAILFNVDGTPAGNQMGGEIIFQTSADGSQTLAERMSINNAGLLTVNQGYISQASSTVVGDFTATGAGQFDSTLGVTGLSTLTAGYIANASSTVVGDHTITGNHYLGGEWFSQQGNLGLTLTDNGSDLTLLADVGGVNSFFIDTAGTFIEIIANPGPSNDDLMIAFEETQGADTSINFYEGGTGNNRIWNSGSMRLGGNKGSTCATLGASVLVDCDTPGTGADLVVQDDIQALGDLYIGGNITASSTITFEGLSTEGFLTNSTSGVVTSSTTISQNFIDADIARDTELHDAVTLAGEDFLSLSTQQITANAINADNLSATDFGDWTCNGTTCSLDSGSVDSAEIATNAVGADELSSSAIQAGDYPAGGIDGDDVNSNIAGRSLTLTSASPDTLDVDAELYTDIFTIHVASSTLSTTTSAVQHKEPNAITVTRVSCSTDTGTTTIQLDERSEGTPNTGGTDILGSPALAMDCGSGHTNATTTFANSAITADNIINLDIDKTDDQSGGATPTRVRIHVEYTTND